MPTDVPSFLHSPEHNLFFCDLQKRYYIQTFEIQISEQNELS